MGAMSSARRTCGDASINTVHRELQARWLGRVDYEAALALQQAINQAVFRGESPDTLLLLEHPPTITQGRSAKPEHLLLSKQTLAEAGVSVIDAGRGGDITYHGPGQLVGYLMLDLRPDRCDVRRYMRDLEAMLIQTCEHFGVQAEREAGLTGVWHAGDKIAAIGVRISRWVSLHGFALNVQLDPEAFAPIVPCGLHGRRVGSLHQRIKDRPAPSTREVAGVVVQACAKVFGRYAASLQEGSYMTTQLQTSLERPEVDRP